MLRSLQAFSTAISCMGKHQACPEACHRRMGCTLQHCLSAYSIESCTEPSQAGPACRHCCRKARSLPPRGAAPPAKHGKALAAAAVSKRDLSKAHTSSSHKVRRSHKSAAQQQSARGSPCCRSSSFQQDPLSAAVSTKDLIAGASRGVSNAHHSREHTYLLDEQLSFLHLCS